jgi:hypothetical protein
MKPLAITLAMLAGAVSLAGSAVALPAQVSISVGDAQTAEGNSGSRNLSFRVTLSEASGEPVSVQVRTHDEIARSPDDYQGAPVSLQFSAGETTKTYEVQIRGDRKVEPDEFFSVVLFAPTGAMIAEPGGVGTGTIRNDDFPAPLPRTRCKCKRMKLRLAGFDDATSRTGFVKASMTCGTGDVADCAGFVKIASPFATQKPRTFKCKAKKCSSTNTYTLEVRVRTAPQELAKQLRIRSGCRGERGELRTFTLLFPSQ